MEFQVSVSRRIHTQYNAISSIAVRHREATLCEPGDLIDDSADKFSAGIHQSDIGESSNLWLIDEVARRPMFKALIFDYLVIDCGSTWNKTKIKSSLAVKKSTFWHLNINNFKIFKSSELSTIDLKLYFNQLMFKLSSDDIEILCWTINKQIQLQENNE